MPKRSIIAVILMSIVTCGLYNLWWMFITRTEFKAFTGRYDMSPSLELLLSVICFPYFIYWVYMFSSDIAKCQRERGLPVTDNSVVNLLLAIFGFGFISILLIQAQLNELAEARTLEG